MADPDPRADGATPPQGEADAPEFSLQSVYLKDCSFEAPKGPRIDGNWNPQINLDLNTAAESISPEMREVVLTVSVTAKNGDATAFLVEVKQAGIFGVRNLSEEDYRRAVASIAPSVLFPYARAMVSHLVAQGGFPRCCCRRSISTCSTRARWPRVRPRPHRLTADRHAAGDHAARGARRWLLGYGARHPVCTRRTSDPPVGSGPRASSRHGRGAA